MKDRGTGETIQIPGDNYLELGGWLNENTYVLAAGSMSGRGEIRQISAADGKVTKLPLEDPDVEVFTQFGVSHGRIYYTDNHQVLKVFDPGQTKPVSLIRDVWDFQLTEQPIYIRVYGYPIGSVSRQRTADLRLGRHPPGYAYRQR